MIFALVKAVMSASTTLTTLTTLTTQSERDLVSGDLCSYGNHGKGPVWWYPMEKMYSDETRPNPDELQNMKRLLSAALDEILTEGTQ